MHTPSAQERQSRETFASVLADLGVGPESHIGVTGASSLSAVIWLSRHGYQNVSYLRSRGPVQHLGLDALLVAQTLDAAHLEDFLAHGPRVRHGGWLVLAAPELAAAEDPAQRLLAARGYRLEQCVHGRRRELIIARRELPVEDEAGRAWRRTG